MRPEQRPRFRPKSAALAPLRQCAPRFAGEWSGPPRRRLPRPAAKEPKGSSKTCGTGTPTTMCSTVGSEMHSWGWPTSTSPLFCPRRASGVEMAILRSPRRVVRRSCHSHSHRQPLMPKPRAQTICCSHVQHRARCFRKGYTTKENARGKQLPAQPACVLFYLLSNTSWKHVPQCVCAPHKVCISNLPFCNADALPANHIFLVIWKYQVGPERALQLRPTISARG